MEKDSGKLGKKLSDRKVEEDIDQRPQVDKGEEQLEIPTGKSGLSWWLPSVSVPFIIGMVVLVLMYKGPDAGEVDREGKSLSNTNSVKGTEVPKPIVNREKGAAPLKEEHIEKEEVENSVISETKFRSTSRENLTGESVFDMLKDKGFYDRDWNNSASGFPNDFKLQDDGKVVFDHASGLKWQQSGSVKDISYDEAKKYVAQLNSVQYAGYNDWRLPTLEEAMSLMESTEKRSGLNIDPVFDNTQRWIWTSDTNNVALAWLVNFISGNCYTYPNDYFDFTSGGFVRAVR